MNPLIVIPTFISSRNHPSDSPSAMYDHTTPLGSEGELSRCLKSLMRVQGIGAVAVLVAAEPGIEEEAADKVRNVAAQFPQLSIMVVSEHELDIVRRRFEQLNLGRLEYEVGLMGYAAIRNLGLVLANVLGFDSVVFLDDDEIIEDSEFLIKGMYGLGKLTRRGIPILAKTGYYINEEGTYYSMSQDKWYNRYWEQGKAFNAWIDSAMAGPRLSRSNHVCGGCLAIHKEAFKRLSFDPWIVRGEDLDYLLNLRMYGSDIWFDNQWTLRHLPPKTASEGRRFRMDIFRWLYEFRKMEYSRTQIDLQQVKPSSLEPYPGPFLEPGIQKRIKRTARLRSLGRPDKQEYRKAAKAATNEAAAYAAKNCSKYFEFQYVWPELMVRTEGDSILRNALLRSVIRNTTGEDIELVEEEQMEAPSAAIDPGATSEIRLDVAE
ncbi:MAG: glycosyltransferase [Eggerthellaceae bacterium]|nr:glycosyltransferase [Eggerthellaceae bacterium]